MRNQWIAACVLAISLAGTQAMASDHRDGSVAIANPQGDIGDVFAWMSPDATELYLAMTVVPFAGTVPPGATTTNPTRFSPDLKYVFNLNSRPRALDPWVSAAAAARNRTRVQVIATFDDSARQRIRLWVRNQRTGELLAYITGDANTPSGLTSEDGRVRVFAGLRKDPAFVNTAGVVGLMNYARSAITNLTDNGAGCYPFGTAEQTAALQALQTGGNTFANANALAIVVTIDKMLVDTSGAMVGVWASTHR